MYEDIAIATYLLVLWEEERKRERVEQRQSFVDLGCGNGLLVYLLCCEGVRREGGGVREEGGREGCEEGGGGRKEGGEGWRK